jgi:glutamate---cysteine ligase / carboxylate-amine ligase
VRTVGVEEELLIVEPTTGEAMALASLLLEGALAAPAPLAGDRIQHELQEQQIEIDSRPHLSLGALADDLRQWRAAADRAARLTGARVAALGTSPLPVVPTTVPSSRYRAMAERFALLEHEQLTCGCHVHVSVDSDDEAVAVADRIRVWMPVLTALSSNSPFWQGRDTGYASYRSQVWARWPSSGPIEVQGGAATYRSLVADLLRSEAVMDEGMVYFDVRVSAKYPTVEVRVCDVCLWLDDAVVIAGLVRALVETAAAEWRAGLPPPAVPAGVIRAAAWHASRWGAGADLVHPRDGVPRPAAEVVGALMEYVGRALADDGDAALVAEGLDRIMARGSGASRQRSASAGTAGLAGAVFDAVECTHDGT